MPIEFILMAGILGALIGSFLNVLIYRLPRNKDFVMARSACPHCGDPIPFYLNVPLLGFAILLGRCRACKARIHWRYPVVELFSALVFAGSLPLHDDMASIYTYVMTCAVSCALIVHFFIDLEHKLLLDKINVYLLLLILPYSVIFLTFDHWVWGALIGFGGPLLISWAFYKLKGKVGLGGGDIKLWGVLGLLLGPIGILENIFLSSFLGSLVGVALMARKSYQADQGIPFGPFIIVVAMAQLYFPEFMRTISIF